MLEKKVKKYASRKKYYKHIVKRMEKQKSFSPRGEDMLFKENQSLKKRLAMLEHEC